MYYTLFFGLKVTLRGIVSPEGRVHRGFTVYLVILLLLRVYGDKKGGKEMKERGIEEERNKK